MIYCKLFSLRTSLLLIQLNPFYLLDGHPLNLHMCQPQQAMPLCFTDKAIMQDAKMAMMGVVYLIKAEETRMDVAKAMLVVAVAVYLIRVEETKLDVFMPMLVVAVMEQL